MANEKVRSASVYVKPQREKLSKSFHPHINQFNQFVSRISCFVNISSFHLINSMNQIIKQCLLNREIALFTYCKLQCKYNYSVNVSSKHIAGDHICCKILPHFSSALALFLVLDTWAHNYKIVGPVKKLLRHIILFLTKVFYKNFLRRLVYIIINYVHHESRKNNTYFSCKNHTNI